ncbi:MAG: hypothetical protein JXR03_15125 [Cyclobacteriaceae bacterium]
MLEIIAMISLGRTIRNIALEKGLKPSKYIVNMVLLWIGFEIIGAYIGMNITHNLFGSYLFAMAGAVLGGYLAYQSAVKAPPNIN